jgi:hypothetical protein
MKYFNGIDTLDQLKTEYRRLAMENHPDRGGKVEVMQEINADFELAFLIMEKASQKAMNAETRETASSFRREFYTQNGWAGSRYSDSLRLRDIAPLVRGYVKDVYPSWKFSVTQEHYANGCSLHVCLMEAPAPIFTEEGIGKWAKNEIWHQRFRGTEEEAYAYCKKQAERGHLQNWPWYYKWMTDRAREVLHDVEKLVESYRFDDSDSMYDYFSTNFSADYYIGKGDRPVKIVAKRERLQTFQGPENAKRITA